jgi:hypothetical protein
MIRILSTAIAAILLFSAAAAFAGGETFERFQQSFEMQSARMEQKYGVPVLERAVDLGGGKVAVHVTSAWKCDGRETQETNALALFDLLRAADESARPVSMAIFGPEGDSILTIGDAGGEPVVKWTEALLCGTQPKKSSPANG